MKNPFKQSHVHTSNCNHAAPTKAEPPFATGHENESIEAHQGKINYDSKDGFGNALDDERAPSAPEALMEKKIPPAF